MGNSHFYIIQIPTLCVKFLSLLPLIGMGFLGGKISSFIISAYISLAKVSLMVEPKVKGREVASS